MSSGEESGNEASHEIVVLDDLRQWSVKNLKAWLKQRNKKISGNKDVLATRVYKLMNYIDSPSSVEDSSSDEGSSVSNIPTSSPTSWKSVFTEDIPPIREHDVKNHFLYTHKILYRAIRRTFLASFKNREKCIRKLHSKC